MGGGLLERQRCLELIMAYGDDATCLKTLAVRLADK